MTKDNKGRRVAVIEAKRSQIGRMPGGLSSVDEIRLLATVFKGVAKAVVAKEIEGAVVGSSFPNERDNLCRKAVIMADLPYTISSTTISKTCASSDEALAAAYYKILAGKAECMLAGGVEKSNNSSYILSHMKQTIKAQMKGTQPYFADIVENIQENDMTMIAEMLSQRYGIAREKQDDFTMKSIQKALEADRLGYFQEEILPIGKNGLDSTMSKHDEMLSVNRDEEIVRMASPFYLRDGMLTQYNTASVCEGACGMLLMSAEKADELEIDYEYIIRDIVTIGVSKQNMGHAMSVCTEEINRQNHLTLSDIDLFEVNESSAAQVIFTLEQLNLDGEKVNVNGGNLAIGYPIGTTGMRMNISLLHEMQRRKALLGLSVICAGGCMANAVIFQHKDSVI